MHGEIEEWRASLYFPPLLLQNCSVVKTHVYGYGYMKFYLVNMRGVNKFGLFRGGVAVSKLYE